jgi:hypothetical protein
MEVTAALLGYWEVNPLEPCPSLFVLFVCVCVCVCV